MGLGIKVETEEYLGNEDRRWLGTRMGADQCRSVTLDASAFSSYHVSERGFLPSGMTLAKLASGLYAPYGGTSDEVQTVTEGGSGLTSFTLTYSGQTTGAIAAAATAATVQAALEALSNIEVGDVVVTGASGGPYTVTFGGTLADTNVAQMTATPTGGTGTVTIATTTAGGAELGTGGTETAAGLLFSSTRLGNSDGSDLATAADVGVALFWGPGIVKLSWLPTFAGGNAGELDAAGQAELSNFIRFEA